MLRFPNKRWRAEVIVPYAARARYRGIVCFSCGNASAALKGLGMPVLDVSPTGTLVANEWFEPEDIRKTFPEFFDATSGHLPTPLMVRIAKVFRARLQHKIQPGTQYEVPSGSGETIVLLRWAFPEAQFVPIYDIGKGTKFEKRSPLNFAVSNKNKSVDTPQRIR